ncbi:MAG: hypothetical protein HOB58_07630 [Nitrospina sp.]|jgi:hypothetical protein|nr:hypothetical protein [Nitrospina sp.]
MSFLDKYPLKLLSHLISNLIVFGEPDTFVMKTYPAFPSNLEDEYPEFEQWRTYSLLISLEIIF